MANQSQAHGGNYIPPGVMQPGGVNPGATAHGGSWTPHTTSPTEAAGSPGQSFAYHRESTASTDFSGPQQPGYNQVQVPVQPIYYQQPVVAQQPVIAQQPYAIQPVYQQPEGKAMEKVDVVDVSYEAVSDTQDMAEYSDRKLRPIRLKNALNRYNPWMTIRWFHKPHYVRRSGYTYKQGQVHRHRDIMSRVHKGQKDDRYISPFDGKVKTLVVQSVDDILADGVNGTWKRTYIRNIVPWHYRLALWPLNHIDMRESKPRTGEEWALIVGKWILAAGLLTLTISWPSGKVGEIRNSGFYDAFPYRTYSYPKVSANRIEEDPAVRRKAKSIGVELQSVSNRTLRPRYLCFLQNPEQREMLGWFGEYVENWMQGQRSEKNLDYIVVAYTSEQFSTDEDFAALHGLAERAARDAGVPAYWISCSCFPDSTKIHEDVYRISDVIRGCSRLVIAVGPHAGNPSIATADEMLQQWGSRIWTFPEVLLAPSGQAIMVYQRGRDMKPFVIQKNQFAAKVWQDCATSRQLIEHYEGNLILSRLELVTLALDCLNSRRTTEYLPGDHAYALMGLLRIRPTVDVTDSAFQAFARLSLVNDSDKLLERLLCTMPVSDQQPWFCMDDAYGVKLWDIEPSIQISGIGHNDTIFIDGARGANVRWKSFATIAYIKRDSWKRIGARLLLRSSGLLFWISVGLLLQSGTSGGSSLGGSSFKVKRQSYSYGSSSSSGVSSPPSPTVIGAAFLLVISLICVMASPYLLRILYGGKFWGTQPWLFAFEGYLPIETIEKQMFGGMLNRLEWTPFGSPLSRHQKNEFDECVGIDPIRDPRVMNLIQKAKTSAPGEQKIFTLVDSNNMTVTLFQSARPPIGFLMIGSEGGMQRAMGVSLDWTTGTLYRETVLRMETPVLAKMDRIPRAKIGLRRPMESVIKRN